MVLKFCKLLLQMTVVGFLITAVVCEEENTEYSMGIMTVNNANSSETKDFCFSYPSKIYVLSTDPNVRHNYIVKNYTDVDACNNTTTPRVDDHNTLLLLQNRSQSANCSLQSYFNFTRLSDASGIILVTPDRFLVKESYGFLLLALIGNVTANKIGEFVSGSNLFNISVVGIEDSGFDGSMIVLWVLANMCVFLGAFFGSSPVSGGSEMQILDGTIPLEEQRRAQVPINIAVVLALVGFISGTLLLLYFFYDQLVYFFMAIFCLASARALYEIINQICNSWSSCENSMPKYFGCGLHQMMFAVVSIAFPMVWFVFRHHSEVWILQDFLGVCFCFHFLQTLRLPNLKVCTALLVLLFLYDIFFVFITPFMTSNGKSVMVEVATGGSSAESLPLLLKIPHFLSSPCLPEGFSLLGFGDIIVPGFLVAYAHTFDLLRGSTCRPYFITTMFGYGFGLAMAFIALFLTRSGQPALLYVVPAILVPIFIVGFLRKEVKALWLGTPSVPEIAD